MWACEAKGKNIDATECPKIYRKSVLHDTQYMFIQHDPMEEKIWYLDIDLCEEYTLNLRIIGKSFMIKAFGPYYKVRIILFRVR